MTRARRALWVGGPLALRYFKKGARYDAATCPGVFLRAVAAARLRRVYPLYCTHTHTHTQAGDVYLLGQRVQLLRDAADVPSTWITGSPRDQKHSGTDCIDCLREHRHAVWHRSLGARACGSGVDAAVDRSRRRPDGAGSGSWYRQPLHSWAGASTHFLSKYIAVHVSSSTGSPLPA